MKRENRWVILSAALVLMLIPLSGCYSTAAKQAIYAVVGAQGEFYEVEVVKPRELTSYRSLRIEPFDNDLGRRLPTAVVREVNKETPKMLAETDLFYPDGKQLLVRGRIIHYTGMTDLEGSVMAVIGKSEECVCRVQLLDGESEQLVGEAVCWGVTKSAIRRGSSELGEGVGKAVAKWIRKRMPEPEKERRRADLRGENDEDRDDQERDDED